jgi:transposase
MGRTLTGPWASGLKNSCGAIREYAIAPYELTPEGAEALIGDKGYDSDALVQTLEARGMEAVIPPRSNRTEPHKIDGFVYKERHLIECFFNKIKHYRRIFSRYEKTARNDIGMLRFVSALIWLR